MHEGGCVWKKMPSSTNKSMRPLGPITSTWPPKSCNLLSLVLFAAKSPPERVCRQPVCWLLLLLQLQQLHARCQCYTATGRLSAVGLISQSCTYPGHITHSYPRLLPAPPPPSPTPHHLHHHQSPFFMRRSYDVPSFTSACHSSPEWDHNHLSFSF